MRLIGLAVPARPAMMWVMKIKFTSSVATGRRVRLARFTVEHSASHYGMPALVLSDGSALRPKDWVRHDAQVITATSIEMQMLQQFLAPLGVLS